MSKYERRLVSALHGLDIRSSSPFCSRFRVSQMLNVSWPVDFDFQSKPSKVKQNELESTLLVDSPQNAEYMHSFSEIALMQHSTSVQCATPLST